MTDPLAAITGLFAGPGARDYLGEAVSVAAHMLQAGALAEAAGAPAPVVAAALLHDVGHLVGAIGSGVSPGKPVGSGVSPGKQSDNGNGDAGADWLAQWFPEAVMEPVRLHVAAKRYLCAVEPGYFGRLSPASVYTLSVQGGPMSAAETAAFEALSFAQDAVALRRWDDDAKDPDAPTPDLGSFSPLIAGLIRP
jgi:gamma-butyrobetaine dioxygenase